MIDQTHIDLVALVGRDVPLHRDGRTMRGRCPIHGGHTNTSLTIYETPHGQRWRCWAGCNEGRAGDAIAWLTTVHGLDFKAACAALGAELPAHDAPPPPPTPPDNAQPPPERWQSAALALADDCAARLWQPEGATALRWLRGRGFTDATITAAQLGYLSEDTTLPGAYFGLDQRRITLPRGVVMPWLVDGAIWRLFIRTPQHRKPWGAEPWPKYHQLTGGGNAPWGIDRVQSGKPIMLLEGLLDALAVQQEAADVVTPIVAGTTGARRVRWIARLALAPLALLSYDADAGGDAPTVYWRGVLPHTRVWRAYFDDPAAMLATGPGTVRGWVEAGLRAAGAAPEPVQLPEPVVTAPAAAAPLASPEAVQPLASPEAVQALADSLPADWGEVQALAEATGVSPRSVPGPVWRGEAKAARAVLARRIIEARQRAAAEERSAPR